MSEKRKNTPKLYQKAFICPHCGTFAKQDWSVPLTNERDYNQKEIKLLAQRKLSTNSWNYRNRNDVNSFYAAYRAFFPREGRVVETRTIVDMFYLICATCQSCEQSSLWFEFDHPGDGGGHMIYPDAKQEPLPPEASQKVRMLYEEADMIASRSPRAAAALLRSTIELLCKELLGEELLGEDHEHINLADLIKKTAKKHKFDKRCVKAMHAIRRSGNRELHPALIDYGDSSDPDVLFALVRYIVWQAISQPQETEEYLALVDKKLEKNR